MTQIKPLTQIHRCIIIPVQVSIWLSSFIKIYTSYIKAKTLHYTPSSSSNLLPFIPLCVSAGMATALSSIRSGWETTTPWSRRNTKRSTASNRSSSIHVTTPRATITTWHWSGCHPGQWARHRGTVCHSAVMSSPPVCRRGKSECSNKPITVTSPAGATQVRVCVCVRSVTIGRKSIASYYASLTFG